MKAYSPAYWFLNVMMVCMSSMKLLYIFSLAFSEIIASSRDVDYK